MMCLADMKQKKENSPSVPVPPARERQKQQGKNKKKSPARFAAETGILAALALALSFLESLLPVVPFLPPGAKLGLANTVVMFSALAASVPQTLAVVFIKSAFLLFQSGASAFFISLCGGLLSVSVLLILIRIRRLSVSMIALSVVSAIAHNIGQLIAASILSGTGLWGYLPALLFFGAVFGVITGVVLKVLMPALLKLQNSLHR